MGAIQQMMLMYRKPAASGPPVAIQNETITKINGYIGYYLNSNGTIYGYGNGDGSWNMTMGTWLLSGTAADYEAKYTAMTGSWQDNNYTFGVWRRLNISPAFQPYTSDMSGTSMKVEVRAYGGDGTILDTAIITVA